jgi:hypothetical protein
VKSSTRWTSFWQLAIVALLCIFASASYANQVEVNLPAAVTVSKNADNVEITFEVVNTGVPIKLNVDIGQITEFVAPQVGDTKNHILSTNSIISTTCGTLGIKQSCTVNALYDVLNGNPFDKVNPARDGVWIAGLNVPWTSSDEQSSGIAQSFAGVTISVSAVGATAVPELSIWAMMLLGFGGLWFAGYGKARVAAA